MKKVMFAAALLTSPLIGLIADEGETPTPLVPVHEHRINFGLLNIGYERIQPNSVYTGLDAKIGSFIHNEKEKSQILNNYVNGEIRLGYNFLLNPVDSLTGYGGVGFSVFSVEKEEGKLRSWNYGALGAKYFHQFGEIFEMGIHFKCHMGISQKRYIAVKTKKAKTEVLGTEKRDRPETEIVTSVTPAIKLQSENTETNLTAVRVSDSRFIIQLGLPLVWHVGAQKNWEFQFEPYYMQIPNKKLAHIIGSNIAVGYRY